MDTRLPASAPSVSDWVRGRLELRQPLGVTIIGGLIASQLLTLLTTPVVYVYLDRLRGRQATNGCTFSRHGGDGQVQPA